MKPWKFNCVTAVSRGISSALPRNLPNSPRNLSNFAAENCGPYLLVVDDVAMLLLHHVLILSWDVWAELLFSLSQVKVKFHVINDEDMLGSEHTTSWFTV